MLRLRPIFRLVNRRASSDLSRATFPSDIESATATATASISPPKSALRLRRVFCRFIKFGSLSVLAATAYVSYAYTLEEVHLKTLGFRAYNITSDDPVWPVVAEYYKSYIAEERDEKTKSFRKSTDRDEDPNILGYTNSFISDAKAVAAKVIDNYVNMRYLIEELVKENFAPPSDKLLPDMNPNMHKSGVYTLVLDLNETLVHSRWKPEFTRDEQSVKRPGLDEFLQRIRGTSYELVLYTDELFVFVNPLVLSLENIVGFIHILTRASTKYQDGKLYRDLSKLNRDPSKILYVSGHALENCLQPENCVPIKPWKEEADDTTLIDLLPFLEYVANERPDDIRTMLASFKGQDIAALSKLHQRRILELEERRKLEERQMMKWKRGRERRRMVLETYVDEED